VNITRVLVEMGAKLDEEEFNHENTALHIACMAGNKDIVETLATMKTFQAVFHKQNK